MKETRYIALTITFTVIYACIAGAQTHPMDDSAAGVEGVILISPSHPGPIREGVPSSAPLAGKEFSVQNQSGQVASFKTDEQGHFRVNLAPGHYTISLKDGKRRIGRFGPFEVDVVAGKMTKVEWACDSGMR